MSLTDLLAGGPNVLVDRRAHLRDVTFPSAVVVKHVAAHSTTELLDAAMRGTESPAAVIATSGKTVVLSAGGSGIVWVAGTDTTSAQARALKVVTAALESLIVKPVPVKAVTKRRRKPSAVIVEESEIEGIE